MDAGFFLILIYVLFRAPALGLEEEIDRSLYHSASILSQDYREMLDRFKLFIYPAISNAAAPDLRDDPQETGADRAFFRSLMTSGFVTNDPEEAHLLVLPASVSSLRRRGGSSSEKMIAHTWKAYVQQLRDLYPYWQRALGADHVFISCQDFKSDWSRNVLELKKNAIQIACFPLDGNQDFFPHKDITIPDSSSAVKAPAAGQERIKLAIFNPLEDELIPEAWRSDEDFLEQSFLNASSSALLRSSKFCLSLGLKDRGIIIDSLRSGCIPVVFSSGRLADLPFQDILDWNQLALILSHEQLPRLKHILESVDESAIYRLRSNGAAAAKHMQWHSPPQLHDALHMTLYQLWRRHYAVRYADRNSDFM